MSGETIIIIEDEALIAAHLKQVLSCFGYSVLQIADNGLDAVRWACVLAPDLILMDIQLKGEMDGIEATLQIHSRTDIPVVFLTAFADEPLLKIARQSGPYGYLVKPVQDQELRSTIEMALYRHKIDHKLQESEMAYRELYHNTPAMLHTTDPEGILLQVSDYWLSMLGYSREEVIHHSITDFVTAPFRSLMVSKYIPRKASSGPIRDVEVQFQKRGGQVIDALFSADSVFDEDGRLMYTHSAIIDITDRKRAEAAERDQRALAEALRDSAAALNTTLSLEEVLERLLSHVGRVVPYHTVNIMMVENGMARVVRSHADLQSGGTGSMISDVEIVEETPYLKQMAETGMPIAFPDTASVEGWSMPWARSYAGAPIMVKGRLVGFINVTSRDVNFYHPGLAYRLQTFANQSAVAIENANLYAELQRLATLDELTSILNRRRLFELGRLELDRSRRYKMPLSVILLDLDHFKKVNDTFGHPTGDRVLAGLASAISRNIREVDLFGRYGGEEFVILLPQSSLASAQEAAERMREIVSGLQFQTNQGILRVTVSLGIAELNDQVHTLAALVDRADQAMYAAKQAGRNRVEIYDASVNSKTRG